jgi:sulfur relay protein TusB/DsrH
VSANRESAGVLHLLMSTRESALEACRSCCQGDDTVVLLDAGAMVSGYEAASAIADFPCKVAVSAPDALARGLAEQVVELGLERIGDADLVRLIEAHQHCLSWR